MSSANGSHAPECSSPACSATITGPVTPSSAARSASGPHPALLVGLDQRRHPEPRVAERQRHRRVHLRAGEHGHRRRADQSAHVDVPVGRREHRVPAGHHAHEVGHGRAGREADLRVGQVQDVEQPAPGDLLHRGDRRAWPGASRRSGPTRSPASRRRAPPAACRRSPSRRSGRSPSPSARARPWSRSPRPHPLAPSARPAAARRTRRAARRCRPRCARAGRAPSSARAAPADARRPAPR